MKTRVVVLSNRSLLATGIGKYLAETGDIEVAEVSFDSPSWRRQLRTLAPRAVLMDGASRRTAQALVGPILTDLPGTEVVVLNFEQSDLRVYSSKHVVVSNVDELVRVVREKPARRSPRKRAHAAPAPVESAAQEGAPAASS